MYDSNVVREGYNTIADEYLKWVNGRPTLHKEKLEQVLALIPPKSRILELGCGAGVPITKTLLDRGYTVTANDLSDRQIELARKHVLGATYILGDMTTLELESSTFNAVLAFYTIFHIPREQHYALFTKLHGSLKPGGYFLSTFYIPDSSDDLGFMGAASFYSGYGPVETVKMLEEIGFEILQDEVRSQGDADVPDDPDNGVSFHWVLAKKS